MQLRLVGLIGPSSHRLQLDSHHVDRGCRRHRFGAHRRIAGCDRSRRATTAEVAQRRAKTTTVGRNAGKRVDGAWPIVAERCFAHRRSEASIASLEQHGALVDALRVRRRALHEQHCDAAHRHAIEQLLLSTRRHAAKELQIGERPCRLINDRTLCMHVGAEPDSLFRCVAAARRTNRIVASSSYRTSVATAMIAALCSLAPTMRASDASCSSSDNGICMKLNFAQNCAEITQNCADPK